MSLRAIILAAGKGTRMLPLTETLPKPLIPVQGKPLIDWCIEWLHVGGVRHVVVNTAYQAEKLHNYLQGYVGVEISYEGEEPLETGGGIARALDKLGDAPFLAMNSDAIFLPQEGAEHPVTSMRAAWDDASADFLMLLVPKPRALAWQGKGDFMRNPDGTVRRAAEGEEAEYIFTGVELIHPRVFTDLPKGAFSLNRLWERSRDAQGVYQRVRSVALEGAWLNVGDADALPKAEAILFRDWQRQA